MGAIWEKNPEKNRKKIKKSRKIFGGIKICITFALANETKRIAAKGWPLRLSVRTKDFHSLKRGSIPLEATNY